MFAVRVFHKWGEVWKERIFRLPDDGRIEVDDGALSISGAIEEGEPSRTVFAAGCWQYIETVEVSDSAD